MFNEAQSFDTDKLNRGSDETDKRTYGDTKIHDEFANGPMVE